MYRIRTPVTLGPIGLLPTAGPEEQRRVRNICFAALGVLALVVILAMAGVFTIRA
jgi:hypothetical protein